MRICPSVTKLFGGTSFSPFVYNMHGLGTDQSARSKAVYLKNTFEREYKTCKFEHVVSYNMFKHVV